MERSTVVTTHRMFFKPRDLERTLKLKDEYLHLNRRHQAAPFDMSAHCRIPSGFERLSYGRDDGEKTTSGSDRNPSIHPKGKKPDRSGLMSWHADRCISHHSFKYLPAPSLSMNLSQIQEQI